MIITPGGNQLPKKRCILSSEQRKGGIDPMKPETVVRVRKVVTTVGGIRIQPDLLLDEVFPDNSACCPFREGLPGTWGRQ